jgi:hypothetical protein
MWPHTTYVLIYDDSERYERLVSHNACALVRISKDGAVVTDPEQPLRGFGTLLNAYVLDC